MTKPLDGGAPIDIGSPDLGPSDLGLIDLGLLPDAGPRCAPEPSGDTRWAQYPMPGTSGHPRSYQVTGTEWADAVIDCVTGLEWQRVAPGGTYARAAAVAYCDGLTLAGYTDWRLPSRIELVTLVDYSMASPGPTIDATVFPGTPGAVFWTSSSVAGSSSYGWGVGFMSGGAGGVEATHNDRARCVRGNDAVSVGTGAPAGHFTDLGDGTVRDNATGLVWQQAFSAGTQSQTASVAYCSTLAVPSGGGWRLPTIAELQTLVDETVFPQWIDTAYFPSTPEEPFWSASSVAGSPSSAWNVGGSGVASNYGDATYDTYRARCVR